MKEVAKQAAQILLEIEAVCLSHQAPFTWASGLKAPIYTDNRLIMSYPDQRRVIEGMLGQLIKDHYPQVTMIAGTATAGIPHAAFVASDLHLPMTYVRSSAKDHGKGRAIEGKLRPEDQVVVVEDLISTGRSVLNAAKQVQAEGAKVLGVVSIFNYQLPSGQLAFDQAGIPFHSLTDYTTLLQVAADQADLASHLSSLEVWHQDPKAWSQDHS